MQSICSIAAVIVAIASPGQCQVPADSAFTGNGVTKATYVAGLPAHRPDFAFGLPKMPAMPQMPRMPRVPKPKWP